MSDDHACNQGGRFDNIETAIKDMHETLKQLTNLLISKAASDIKLDTVIASNKDHEDRLRVLEAVRNENKWPERIVWAVVIGIVLAYFNLK